MKVIKKLITVLLAMLIAASCLSIGFAESEETENAAVKSTADIRMYNYYDTIKLLVFSDVRLADYETVNIYQRNETNEKTLLASFPVYEHCYNFFDEPETIFVIESLEVDIFSAQGSYTLDLIAKEAPPEIRKNDVSIDFEYEDILNPEIEHQTYNYQIAEGETTDISEIITLPEGYLSIYYLTEYNDSVIEFAPIAEINGTSIKAVSRGDTVISVNDAITHQEIAEINLKVIPETPDSFLGLLGSTLGIFGEDSIKNLITLGTFGGLGLSGLGFTILFPFVALFSFIGAILGIA